jgi:protein-tyrosine phosphatase
MILSLARRTAAPLLVCTSLAAAPVLAAPPADAVVQRQGEDRLVVTWKSAVPVDVLVADRADALPKAARLVSARDGDGSATVTDGARRTFVILRNARTGEITRVAERVLPLEAGSNFRDIGGYPAAGGKHVRWGLIYRSGATPMLTERDRARIAALGLASMVDLRSDEERQLAPSRIDGVPYTAVGYSMGTMGVGGGGINEVYSRMPATFAPQVRQVFARLLRREVPLVYNCSAGQDRTGFTTALVLSALGTPYATIVQDYHLSTKYRRPEYEMPKIDPALYPGNTAAALFGRMQSDPRYAKPNPLLTAEGKPYLDFAFAELQRRWGGVNGYLEHEIGLTPKDIARLRELYTQ